MKPTLRFTFIFMCFSILSGLITGCSFAGRNRNTSTPVEPTLTIPAVFTPTTSTEQPDDPIPTDTLSIAPTSTVQNTEIPTADSSQLFFDQLDQLNAANQSADPLDDIP